MAKGQVTVAIVGDVSDLSKKLGVAGGDLDRFGSKVQSSGERLKDLGGKATLFASLPIAAVMTGAAAAASDLEQSVGAVESTFGKASGPVKDFAEDAAQEAGLSMREVNEAAALLGSQMLGLGFNADEAAQKTVDLEKRAADMAATFGGPTSDAVQAISGVLKGERDSIEKYGVSMKQADVDARVMALGLDTSTTAAEKKAEAVASLDLLLEQTAKTEGAFARESDTAAGSLARARAEMENATAELGTALLPIAAKAGGVVADLADKFTDLPQPVQNAVLAIAGMAAAAGPVLTVAGNVAQLHQKIKDVNFAAVAGKGIFGALGLAIAGMGIQAAASGELLSKHMSLDVMSDQVARLARMTDQELGRAVIETKNEIALFTIAAEENVVVAQRWRDALADAGQNTSKIDPILDKVTKRHRELRDSTADAADAVEGSEKPTRDQADAYDDLAAATGRAKTQAEQYAAPIDCLFGVEA